MATDPTQMFGALLGTLQQTGNIGRDATDYANQQQAAKQQLTMGAIQLAAAQQQQDQQAQYQQDVQSYYADPTLERLSALAAKYPQQAAALKQSYDIMNEAQRQSAVTQFGSLYNAADNGKVDLVRTQLSQIKKAEQAQGIDTTDIDNTLDALDADPSSAMNMIKGFAQVHLAAAGVDKFQIGDQQNHFGTAGDGTIYDQRTGQVVHESAPQPKYMTIKNADGSESIVAVGGGDPASGSGGAPQPPGAPLDPRQFFKDFILPHEGGYAAHDANGAPVNYGINQSANPGVDVKNLTPDQAADIFTNKYWAQSGSANLPPALAAVNADTAYINPARAQQFLKASGGDPQKYLAMRKAWMASLVNNDPDTYAKYAKAWANRNADLAQYMQQVGGGGTASAPSSAPGVSVLYTSKPPDGNTIPGDISLTGPAYLATIPKNIATQVKALSEGRLPLPSSFALSKPYWQNLLQITAQYDPTFDAANAATRRSTRQFFTSGKGAQNITSFNTALAHLGVLDSAIDNLDNWSGVPILNSTLNAVRNATLRSSGDSQNLKNFESARQAVIDELERSFRGSAGTLEGIRGWEKQLSETSSPQELHAVVKQIGALLGSRIQALGEQYNSGMGRSIDPIQLLDPHAQHVLRSINPEAWGQTRTSITPTPIASNSTGGFRILRVRPAQ